MPMEHDDGIPGEALEAHHAKEAEDCAARCREALDAMVGSE